ncbi:DUF2309 domain-containing protein [Haloplanus sp. C73]|uniref:DUF2309 domain-containing protein n=1 Tax=Haloplanus sp. C73 TaxID=3421641 RepID=UPI003EBA7356
MSTEPAIRESIEQAASTVGRVWPVHSFVANNPLADLEDQPFHEAVAQAEAHLDADGYPDTDVFRRAWNENRIDPDELAAELAEHGYDADPAELLDRMEREQSTTASDPDPVDRIVTKWLAAFLDQGHAKWSMPNREDGFYAAFRSLAPHDDEIPDGVADVPDDPIEAIRHHLDDRPVGEWHDVFEAHLTALPGWTGFIKRRADEGDAWQSAHPITLPGYLAVRLALTDLLDAPTPEPPEETDDGVPLAECWLRAWEATYRETLTDAVADASEARDPDEERPDAQLVFCIDTRSEVIRRHVERAGAYETFGYAGSFGLPIRYEGYDADTAVDACPPVVDAQHHVTERPTDEEKTARHDRWQSIRGAGAEIIESLESNVATAFSFVESAGLGYGAALAARTLAPARAAGFDIGPDPHEFCTPGVDHDPHADTDLPSGLTREEKVEYAAAAFETMGWETFARLVVFTGHASQTANNPFEASLDCGACAGNPGGPNARALATICNEPAVKAELRDRGIEIPEDTVFLAAEHDTTTDAMTLYDGDVPESHREDVAELRAALDEAQAGAAAERDGDVSEAERRATDWAETRPEWGLAGNAGFVVGPRDLTADLNLDGRSFLHSYDWETDSEGDALEAVMTGPMVVTQWINLQYYFSTVDTAVFGSGSKVTHNPVGNLGVYQGNGGDLMAGLPQQSVLAGDDDPHHQPLRLSTVIHAPVDRVTDILAANENLTTLLDNGWLSLTVVDPTRDHRAFHYERELEWAAAATPEAAPVADD